MTHNKTICSYSSRTRNSLYLDRNNRTCWASTHETLCSKLHGLDIFCYSTNSSSPGDVVAHWKGSRQLRQRSSRFKPCVISHNETLGQHRGTELCNKISKLIYRNLPSVSAKKNFELFLWLVLHLDIETYPLFQLKKTLNYFLTCPAPWYRNLPAVPAKKNLELFLWLVLHHQLSSGPCQYGQYTSCIPIGRAFSTVLVPS